MVDPIRRVLRYAYEYCAVWRRDAGRRAWVMPPPSRCDPAANLRRWYVQACSSSSPSRSPVRPRLYVLPLSAPPLVRSLRRYNASAGCVVERGWRGDASFYGTPSVANLNVTLTLTLTLRRERLRHALRGRCMLMTGRCMLMTGRC